MLSEQGYGQLDISTWYCTQMLRDGKCPNCGINFADQHPASNLYPHWTGDCGKEVTSYRYEMTRREIQLADAREIRANWIFYIVLALSAALVIAFVLYGVPWVNAVIDKWLQG